MKIKTSELTGSNLDRVVAITLNKYKTTVAPPYSNNWALGGPIIEDELIRIIEPSTRGGNWVARIRRGSTFNELTWFECTGPTALISAMRCYVASKLGDFVDVPEELI